MNKAFCLVLVVIVLLIASAPPAYAKGHGGHGHGGHGHGSRMGRTGSMVVGPSSLSVLLSILLS